MTPSLLVLASVRLAGVERPWLWLLLIAAGAAVLFYAYRDIYRRTSHTLVWWLMGLRVLGLLLLLLALAKPVWTGEIEQTDPGLVGIVVDTSRSMSLSDGASGTRYARARTAVERLREALSKQPGSRLTVDLFDITGVPIPAFPDKPTADRTDLERALKQTRKHTRSRPLRGVVLVSDGMDNTGRTSFRDLEDTRIPVHTLGFPETERGDLDLALRKPQVPERVLVHNEMRVEVPVSKTGKGATEATVAIKRGQEVLASKTVSFAEGKGEQVVALTFTPRQPGSFVLTATVQSEAAERYRGNNSAHFPLRIDAEPIRVLYLEGFLREEYKFLKARLEDDPDLSLIASVRRVAPEVGEGRPGAARLTAELLKNIDVVILGDMESSYLNAGEYQQLLRWLDGKNHSLLVLGGYASFGAEGFRNSPLAAVLPVVFAPNPPYQSEDAFELTLAEKGKGHPMFTLSGDRIKDAEAWSKAPRLQGMSLVQGLKPGAEELASNPRVQVDGKPAVAAAVQRAPGGGQVLVLTIDTTWRWSRLPRVLGQADTLYARFWSQTIRWLAGRGLDDQRPPLTVSTDRPDYQVGKKVTVRLERQPNAKLEGEPQVSAQVVPPSGEPITVPLKGDSGNPDVATGEFFPSAGGRYEVAATLSGGGKLLANQTAEFMVQGEDVELADTGVNPRNLKDLADATGGVYLDVDNAADLAGKIVAKERRTVREVKNEYWDSPLLFAAFIGVVAAEWVLRRRNHLI